MKFSEFRQYRPRPDHNVFVFICEDDLLVEESGGIWTAAFGGNWTIEKIHAKEFEGIASARLMDIALTPSLFSQSRAIIVTNPEKLSKDKVKDLADIHAVAKSALKIVVVSNIPKAAEGLMKSFPVVTIDPLRPGDAARWLIDRYRTAPEIARYMVENVGTDLYLLRNEMEKLRTYVGDSRPIEVRDVDVLILRSEQFGPYEFDDAVLARDYKRAVKILAAMFDEGTEPLMVLGRLARVWRQLLIGKGLCGKHSAKDVAAAAGVPAFKSSEFMNSCKKFEWPRVASGFRELLNADRALKTSSPNVGAYFDVMLWKLIGSSG